jgi:hypothetical protein
VEFFLLWGKIFVFYVLAQLCGGFEWTNDGFCRTDKGFNITRPENEVQVDYDHVIEYKVAAYKTQLQDEAKPKIWNLYNLFGKKKVIPTMGGNLLIPTSPSPPPLIKSGTGKVNKPFKGNKTGR